LLPFQHTSSYKISRQLAKTNIRTIHIPHPPAPERQLRSKGPWCILYTMSLQYGIHWTDL
jgi:hypothetical protein